MLILSRPLVFLDLETTGLDKENDRIVSIAMYKVFSFDPPVSSGSTANATLLQYNINPGRPIPAASTDIHGITDADVADCPPFHEVAHKVQLFIAGCDIAGFGSNHYDVPLLYHEFQRAGIYWQPGHLIDVGNIFKINEPRTLSAAMRFYTGREIKVAHTAAGDVMATVEVFAAQMGRYDMPDTVEELALFSNYGNRMADISGKFYYDKNGVVCFNFGPHRDRPALEHPDYLDWMWSRDFPADTQVILKGLLNIAYEADDEQDDDGDYDEGPARLFEGGPLY